MIELQLFWGGESTHIHCIETSAADTNCETTRVASQNSNRGRRRTHPAPVSPAKRSQHQCDHRRISTRDPRSALLRWQSWLTVARPNRSVAHHERRAHSWARATWRAGTPRSPPSSAPLLLRRRRAEGGARLRRPVAVAASCSPLPPLPTNAPSRGRGRREGRGGRSAVGRFLSGGGERRSRATLSRAPAPSAQHLTAPGPTNNRGIEGWGSPKTPREVSRMLVGYLSRPLIFSALLPSMCCEKMYAFSLMNSLYWFCPLVRWFRAFLADCGVVSIFLLLLQVGVFGVFFFAGIAFWMLFWDLVVLLFQLLIAVPDVCCLIRVTALG
jgi:hypothetical protein